MATSSILNIFYKGNITYFGNIQKIGEIKRKKSLYKTVFEIDLTLPVSLVQSAIAHYWHEESNLHKALDGLEHTRKRFSFVPPLVLPQKIKKSLNSSNNRYIKIIKKGNIMRKEYDKEVKNKGDIEEYRRELVRKGGKGDEFKLFRSICEELGDDRVWKDSSGKWKAAPSDKFMKKVQEYDPKIPIDHSRVANPLYSSLWERAEEGNFCTPITYSLIKVFDTAREFTSSEEEAEKAFREAVDIFALMPTNPERSIRKEKYDMVEEAITNSIYWKNVKAFLDNAWWERGAQRTLADAFKSVQLKQLKQTRRILDNFATGENLLEANKSEIHLPELPSIPEMPSGDISASNVVEEHIGKLTKYIGDLEEDKAKLSEFIFQMDKRIAEARNLLEMVKCREQVIQKIIIDEDIEESEVNKLDIELKKKEDRHVAIKEDLLEWQKQIECKNPEQKKVIVNRFDRDERLSKYIKELYNWKCQFPNCELSFLKRDGQPYIEVHHLFALSKDGHDSIENILVVCAHHHRMLEYADVSILNVTPYEVIVMINGERHVIKRIILQ